MTRPPKFTIAALMGLVALCAATFAALRTSSPHWASAMVSVTVLVLLGSVVASLRWPPSRRLVRVRDFRLRLLPPDVHFAVP